jgi:radical SAM superfamily enzyme YgiQ (UPF0313 family)
MNDRKLRFLFIQPQFNRHYLPTFPVYEPLHGLLLANVAKEQLETKIFDRRFDTDRNLIRLLNDFKPDLVGLTTHTAGEVHIAIRLMQLVKSCRPSATTIVGGQHATLLPEDLFSSAVDLICIGPGEETFKEVVQALATNKDCSAVSGLAIRSGSNYLLTAPREIRSGKFSWPIFDRSIIPRKYRRHYTFTFENRSNVYTITTTGCPHRCTFCSLWATARGTYRRREPDEIVQDILSQSQSYVHLTDDNTFDNEAHAAEICRLLKKHGVKKKIMAYARADTIINKSDLLKEWSEAGLGALVVGMEAASDKHLKQLNKHSSVSKNEEAHRILEELDIENWGHFVIMPDFQKEDFELIWDFVDRNNMTYPIFVPMTPVPGTPLFFDEKNKDNITCYDYGFYLLQYMVVKTALPKREWYKHFWNLYHQTNSAKTLMRRKRMSPSFHWRPALGRAHIFNRALRIGASHIEEQMYLEEQIRYEDIEHLLLPSMRKDYVPNKYYNAPTIGEMKQAQEHSLVSLAPSNSNFKNGTAASEPRAQ